MKYLFVLLLTAGLFAQTERSSNWGGAFDWGTTFADAGSTKVHGTQTNINGAAVLYTNALPIQENTNGVYCVYAQWDSVDAGDTDLELEVRYGVLMERRTSTTDMVVKWDGWQAVFDAKSSNTLYTIYIARSDSSWHVPANFRQYRTFRGDVDVDTCTAYVTDFLR